MAHTPAPWQTEKELNEYLACAQVHVFDQDDGIIATVQAWGEPRTMIDNARLIAAAPDLLEACKNARAALDGEYGVDDDLEEIDLAIELDNAINKATKPE